jgi:Ca-activated chloride channel family protein
VLDSLADFHFLRPWWLLTLLPLALLIYFWIRNTRQHSTWSAAISQPLLEVLLDTNTVGSALKLRAALWTGAVLSTLALAGPTWEKLPQPVNKKSDALVIVLDLSLSMFAQDISPSRLAKARQKIVDALRLREEGSTGLVAYAGDGHAVVPITDDRKTIENLLSALSPAMMPVLGSRPASGLALAKDLFANAGLVEGRILLITDGIRETSEVSNYRDRAFPISILGIGTPSGGRIPVNRTNEAPRYLTDESGRQIIARLDESRLIQAAQQSYGRYSQITIGDADLELTLSTRLPTEDVSIEVEREFDIWADMGFWLCFPLALMMLMSFRRGLFAACFLLALLPEPSWAETAGGRSGEASETKPGTYNNLDPAESSLGQFWRDLWQRPDQQGYEAMLDNDPASAAALFENQQWQGAAHYRSGDYAASAMDFANDQSPTGLYNQGNALAKQGRYADAIERYQQVLSEQPDQADAAFNKALLEDLLEQQNQQEQSEREQQQQEQQRDQESQSDSSQQDEADDAGKSPEDADEQERESSDQQPDPAPESDEEPMDPQQRDEKQEALEQWLRRVPDDPGGLLRRKFQHETKQRLRQGDYSNRQDEQIW